MNNKNVIKFTPLYNNNTIGAVCSLLELGNVRILLDCGKDHSISSDDISKAVNTIKSSGGVDIILLSHADTQHVSGLPYMFGEGENKLGIDIPIICTVPVLKYSKLCLYDNYLHESMENESKDNDLNKKSNTEEYLDNVDNCFNRICSIKYNQSILLNEIIQKRATDNIKICAYPSGRTIGGKFTNFTFT